MVRWWALAAAPVATSALWVAHLLPGWALLGVVLVCKGILLLASNQSKTRQSPTLRGIKGGDFWSPGERAY